MILISETYGNNVKSVEATHLKTGIPTIFFKEKHLQFFSLSIRKFQNSIGVSLQNTIFSQIMGVVMKWYFNLFGLFGILWRGNNGRNTVVFDDFDTITCFLIIQS